MIAAAILRPDGPQSGVLSWFRNYEFHRECVNSGAATTPSLISIPTDSLRLAPLTSSRFALSLSLTIMVMISMAGSTVLLLRAASMLNRWKLFLPPLVRPVLIIAIPLTKYLTVRLSMVRIKDVVSMAYGASTYDMWRLHIPKGRRLCQYYNVLSVFRFPHVN